LRAKIGHRAELAKHDAKCDFCAEMSTVPFPNSICHQCLHLRTTANARGSVFMMCAKAKDDDRFTKYPPQPVGRCAGLEAVT
jgi:hypothetical protein